MPRRSRSFSSWVLVVPVLLVLASVDDALLPEDCEVAAPWLMEPLVPMSVDCCEADALPVTDWLPLPTFTPGLTLAEAFRSELLTPTFAFRPTLGFTFSVLPESGGVGPKDGPAAALDVLPDAVPDCAAVEPPAIVSVPERAVEAVVESTLAADEAVEELLGLTFTVEPSTTVVDDDAAGAVATPTGAALDE